MNRLLLGIAGHPGAGKTTAGDYLVRKHSFTQFQGSSYFDEEAAKLGIELDTRESYRDFSRRLRAERSATLIADLMLAVTDERVVNVGIRNRQDTEKLLEAGGVIVALECPAEVRFERKAGTDPKYPTDFQAFLDTELPEYDSPDPLGSHTQWAMNRATHVIDTSLPESTLYVALDKIVILHTTSS